MPLAHYITRSLTGSSARVCARRSARDAAAVSQQSHATAGVAAVARALPQNALHDQQSVDGTARIDFVAAQPRNAGAQRECAARAAGIARPLPSSAHAAGQHQSADARARHIRFAVAPPNSAATLESAARAAVDIWQAHHAPIARRLQQSGSSHSHHLYTSFY
jgi:hypothetical protein